MMSKQFWLHGIFCLQNHLETRVLKGDRLKISVCDLGIDFSFRDTAPTSEHVDTRY